VTVLRRGGTAAGLAAAAAALVAGCTTASDGGGTTPPPISTPLATLSSPSESPTLSSALPSVTTSAPAASSTPAPPSTKPSGTDCSMAQLCVDALRGSASAGKEFAAILFTNTSSTACTLTGFPGITLLKGGKQVGSPAQRDTVPMQTMTLKPGDEVQARLSSIVSCQAPISDTVRVIPPNSTKFVDRPLEMRACTLIVGPVGPPD
jgi:hypothetical protein